MAALMYTRLHTLADVVRDQLAEYLPEGELCELSDDDVLSAGQEWLGEDDCDVSALRDALNAYYDSHSGD